MSEHNITADRIYSLDECGVTLEKDCAGRMCARCFMPVRQCKQQRNTDQSMAEFSYKHRVTMMPCVSAAGDCAPPLFIFEGNRVYFDRVVVSGHVDNQQRTAKLPHDAIIATRESVAWIHPSS